jgi:hypothetical protein
MMSKPKVYTMEFGFVYPHLINKVEKKGRTKGEADQLIKWMTGYSQQDLDNLIEDGTDYENFILKAPELNPDRRNITGRICGVKVEDMEESVMKEIRYLDKLIDELAKGKSIEQITERLK